MLIWKSSVPGISLPKSVQRLSINACHRPGSLKNVDLDECPSNKNRQPWSRANLVAALRVLSSITPAASPGGNSIPSATSSISVLSPGIRSSSTRPMISRSMISPPRPRKRHSLLAQQVRQLGKVQPTRSACPLCARSGSRPNQVSGNRATAICAASLRPAHLP
jgi:hypothetical protein